VIPNSAQKPSPPHTNHLGAAFSSRTPPNKMAGISADLMERVNFAARSFTVFSYPTSLLPPSALSSLQRFVYEQQVTFRDLS
jgi:hypothetical protein